MKSHPVFSCLIVLLYSTLIDGQKLPFNTLLVLPARESNNDKFGLTMEKAKPVIDIAIEDVVKNGKMKTPNWMNLTYHDSR